MVGLAGAPAADDKGVPSLDPAIQRPSGVAVDKPGKRVRQRPAREPRASSGSTRRKARVSHFRTSAWPWSTGLPSRPTAICTFAMATGARSGGLQGLTAKGPSIFCRAPGKSSSRTGSRSTTAATSTSPSRIRARQGAYGSGGVWIVPAERRGEGLGAGSEADRDWIVGTRWAPTASRYYHGDLFVDQHRQGLVVRIPVLKDGSAGPIEAWKTLVEVPESLMAGFPTPVMPERPRPSTCTETST